jgi:transmembrane sensor
MTEMDRKLLERYLAGSATAAESESVEAWLAADPERWSGLTALRDALAGADLSETAVEAAMQDVWARLVPEVSPAADTTPALTHPVRRPSLGFPLLERSARRKLILAQLAAALVVLTVSGWLTATLLLRRASVRGEAMRVASTARAERATFRLPDGTSVMLSVASTLRYPAGFTGARREVLLEGEAFFDVVHDEHRTFIVRAGDLVARDLGTQFAVRAYPEDSGARVVVREGKVAILAAADGKSARVVEPGQLGRLTEGDLPTVEQVDTAVAFAWLEGRLVLEGIPLREALPELGRWFDLDFRLADSGLGDVPLSATLKSRPSPDVLANLAASLGMRLRQQDRRVTFFSAEPSR